MAKTPNDNDYLQALNPQQRDAVTYCDGPELVIAGAGSGKTRVLTYKIVHLLKLGYHPGTIMALTFTNKAAREMRDRIIPLVGGPTAARLWMGTFHSIFSRILHIHADRLGYRSNFTIYDATDSKSLIKLIVRDMGLDEKVYPVQALQGRISQLKNALISPTDYRNNRDLVREDSDMMRPEFGNIYSTYCHRCKVAGVMDFDDLLFNTNILLRDNADVLEQYQTRFTYILVDEYQDTNFAQHVIVKQLTANGMKLCVVGDDAQSIYSFRGANIGNILNLDRAYKGLRTFKLERNYRSTQNIIAVANDLIAHNARQIPKNVFSENEPGERVNVIKCYSDFEEAYVVANQIAALKARYGSSYDDFAILYRINALSRRLEEALSSGGRRDSHGNMRDAIPYRIYGGLTFYQRKEVKDALAYLRMAVNPDDDEALRRVINYPLRGIGDTTLKKVQHCAIEKGVSLWQIISNSATYPLGLNQRTLNSLASFTHIIKELMQLVADGEDATTVANRMVEITRLVDVLRGDTTPENISRIENIQELLSGISEFVEIRAESGDDARQLADYLAHVSLLTNQDEDTDDGSSGQVTLMTVHAAKGLEFKHVIITGVEEDLFPAAKSAQSLNGIEEERRLLYVAITRAQSTCTITYSGSRYVNGMTKTCVMSRFLREINPSLLRASMTSSAQSTAWQSHDEFSSRMRMSPSQPTASVSPSKPSRPLPPPPASPRTLRPIHAVKGTVARAGTHTASELQEGMRIRHDRYGLGEIRSIDTSSSDARISVLFAGEDTPRVLLLKFAKFDIL